MDSLNTEIALHIFRKSQVQYEMLANKFKVTKKTIYMRIKKMVDGKIIQRIKKGKYSFLYAIKRFSFSNQNLKEDELYSKYVKPYLPDTTIEATRVLNYSFTEIMNNAISHSDASKIFFDVCINPYVVQIKIYDNGVGIFTKIQRALNLPEKSNAVLELTKGKFTTNPDEHSGEGIFFTSKACDRFTIVSDNIGYCADNTGKHISIFEDFSELDPIPGTAVEMRVLSNHKKSLNSVFEEYASEADNFAFNKTLVPVRLLEYGEQNPFFVSRSQAKRLLLRFEKFDNILLDFSGIKEIGQGFADEIFRVYKSEHPNTKIDFINASNEIKKMINRVQSGLQ